MFGNDTYNEDIKNFKKVFSEDVIKALEEDKTSVVFIGRGSCPYCRKFAKKLGSLASKIHSEVLYVNSEDYSDDMIEELRAKYNVRTVPGFIVKKQGEIEVRCDSSLPEDEILNLAN